MRPNGSEMITDNRHESGFLGQFTTKFKILSVWRRQLGLSAVLSRERLPATNKSNENGELNSELGSKLGFCCLHRPVVRREFHLPSWWGEISRSQSRRRRRRHRHRHHPLGPHAAVVTAGRARALAITANVNLKRTPPTLRSAEPLDGALSQCSNVIRAVRVLVRSGPHVSVYCFLPRYRLILFTSFFTERRSRLRWEIMIGSCAVPRQY